VHRCAALPLTRKFVIVFVRFGALLQPLFSMIPLIAYCYADEFRLVYLCGKLPFL
jgi:hypothetical protein